LACPSWALFPFEVSFESILSFGPDVAMPSTALVLISAYRGFDVPPILVPADCSTVDERSLRAVSASRALADRVASVNLRSLEGPLCTRNLAIVGTESRGLDAAASLALCRCGDSPEVTFTGGSSIRPPRWGLLSETFRGAHREVRAFAVQAQRSRVSSCDDPCSPDSKGGYPCSHRSVSRTDIPRFFRPTWRFDGNPSLSGAEVVARILSCAELASSSHVTVQAR